jgi:cell division protein ZapA (FtsZ GTPase activity inhibitor)
MAGALESVTLILSQKTVLVALNALDALAADEREPERYRESFAKAADEFKKAFEASGPACGTL